MSGQDDFDFTIDTLTIGDLDLILEALSDLRNTAGGGKREALNELYDKVDDLATIGRDLYADEFGGWTEDRMVVDESRAWRASRGVG